jgi:4-hydroxy-tetrahydrodipicolinate synthase
VRSDVGFRGVYVPLITPFDVDGSVDAGAIETLCRTYLDAGVTGIVALGTTGEASALTAAEKQLVIDTCSRVCVERGVQLVVGAGSNATAASVEAARALEGTPGLSAILSVVPYYVRPSEAGIVRHFQTIADAAPAPLILYNIGVRTGRHLSAAGVLEAAQHPNIAGIKQAAPLDQDTLTLLAGAPSGFSVLGGEDPYLFPLALMGGHGAISAAAHVCTRRLVEMIECGLAGKLEDGRAHAEALLPVVQACYAEPNPAVFKAALHAQGLIKTPDVRLPLTNASAGARDAALAAIAAAS